MTDRRYDLDWLRIGAFGLLILYHVGMFYVTWDWHVKSSRASDAIEPLMLLVNPWRLLLLFIISGAATRFMADKMTRGRLLASRSGRLLPPLLFAIFVIVPPQSYYEIVEQIGYAGGWLDFYPRYVTASGHWCDADGCLITPTYNHMWFVAYLFVYTLALVALLPLLRRIPAAWLAPLLRGPLLIIAPAVFLWATRAFLRPAFGETHALVDDWYLHTVYFAGFAFGFAVAKHRPFFEACVRLRHAALRLAVGAYAGVVLFLSLHADAAPSDAQVFWMRGVHQVQAWCAIVALIGFAHLHVRDADGPVRRYLTEAIFPFYIMHQTVIVVAGHYLDPLAWPLWAEGAALIGLTVLVCALAFEIARRAPFLRPLFGLRPKPAKAKEVEAGRSQAQMMGRA